MNHEQIGAQFVTQMRERIANTFIELLGIRLVEVSQERAIGEMQFMPSLQQLTGVFHAGALIALADSTATFACMYWLQEAGGDQPGAFPFTIQLSTNLLRNTRHGMVRAEAVPVHRGRSTQVVETRVSDDDGRLLLVVTTTHLVVAQT
jgi:uncharacterized protein (TIGR00369 family)